MWVKNMGEWDESDRRNSILKAIDVKTKEISDKAEKLEKNGEGPTDGKEKEEWKMLMGEMQGLFLAKEIVKYGHQRYMKKS